MKLTDNAQCDTGKCGIGGYCKECPSIADTAGAKPVNGIPATLRHDEGAIARCSYCGRYSLDPKTLSNRQPKCECGKEHGWSGSFQKPGRDAKWSGATPASSVANTAGASERNALFGRVTDWVNEHRIPFDAQNELFRVLSDIAKEPK